MNRRKPLILGLLLSLPIVSQAQESSPSSGILLLAHGGKTEWNEEVDKLAAQVDESMPVEVAFGMASKRNIQDAIDRLAKRGAREIVAVPLFVSSHSSVITSTQYLLGLRAEAPPELAAYARMRHDHGAHSTSQPGEATFDPTTPVKSPVPIRMTAALDRHPVVADILLSRAQSISHDPDHEVLIVVAHGPVSEDENAKWLTDMSALAEHMRRASSFKRIEYLTVRDDAPEPIRSRAAAELRAVVERAVGEDHKALVVPLLISYGGIEGGIRKRLEGLSYVMSPQALLPDERLVNWVIQTAQGVATIAQASADALLVVAHGARQPGWNERVMRLVNHIQWPGPKGVAFLTTSTPQQDLASVAARLDRAGVNRIIVVPLLVSSFSDHYEEIRYYAGERTEAPAHVHGEPLKTNAKLILTGGMDDDALLARILADQARSISTDPNGESLILVAHGPNGDSDNERWLRCLKAHATYLQQSVGFRRVWFTTLRDDSPKAVRDAATAALREKVRAASKDTKVLVVPVLVSVGRLQSEIKKRLEGLAFQMSASGIADHPLAAEWIRQQGARAGHSNNSRLRFEPWMRE